MLKLLLGENWRANRDAVLARIAQDVNNQQGGRLLLVPEQASFDYERRLCAAAGPQAGRYAEVVSFTRLARCVFAQTGGGATQALDGGGRLLAMAAAVWQLRPQLKAYGAVGSRPEFLSALVTAVDECKSCCITPEVLRAAGEKTQGALRQKVEELALILEGYAAVCAGQDPRDRMTRLLDKLEGSNFAREHVIYIDGFTDFTAQELEILAHFLENSPSVTVSLACASPGTEEAGQELAGETAVRLLRLAGGQVETVADPEADTPLGKMRRSLLSGPEPEIDGLAQWAAATRLSSPREECIYAAARLRELAEQGIRYRDMAVVCSDMSTYGPILRQVLRRYNIPAYFAGNEDISAKSAIFTVLSALDAAVEGLEGPGVMGYLKSVLSPLSPAEGDRLENYAIAWRIRRGDWGSPFTRHPRGLGKEWMAEDEAELNALNESRRIGVMPLYRLAQGMKRGKTAGEHLQALYAFLEEVDMPGRLDGLAGSLEAAGDRQSAQELGQLWDILVQAMEQMAGLMSGGEMEAEVFVRLFRLLLSQYQVGTIPQTLDSVAVGGPEFMRRHAAGYLLVLGAQERLLPKGGAGGMVLSEQERQTLMHLGLPLRMDLYRQLQQELAGLRAVAWGAERRLMMTCGAGQPAYVFRRLSRMLGGEKEAALPLADRLPDAWAAGAALYRAGWTDPPPPAVEPAWAGLCQGAAYTPGRLSPQTVQKLYGRKLTLSASQVDKIAACRFAYFMRYGLGAQARKEITVDPAEFGIFVHDVLEHTARQVCRMGGFAQVSLETVQALAMERAEEYYRQHFSVLAGEDDRLTYLFQRNFQELQAVVQTLWAELRQSQFTPAGFEVKFGPGGQLPGVEIPGTTVAAQLQGLVDRLDVYRKDGQTYVRVVDYKTGRKDFDYCDILAGLGLQMLIYLFALEDVGEAYLGDKPQAAGVLYFPARAPVLPADGPVDGEKAKAMWAEESRRKGLVLADEGVLDAMGREFLPVKQDKSGGLAGDVATAGQLETLKTYVKKTLARLVEEIGSGNVEPNPYFRGNRDACRYCEYAQACHLDLWGSPRVYQSVTPREFWQEVEEKNHGR